MLASYATAVAAIVILSLAWFAVQQAWKRTFPATSCDPDALAGCIEAVDHLSADYKLPGTLAAGDPEQLGAASAACAALALDAGVKSLEHGQMVSEKTVRRIAKEGVFWALNTAGMDPALLQHQTSLYRSRVPSWRHI